MKAPRRKISKEERHHREALRSSCSWVVVWVIRHLFDKGWTTDKVAPQFERIQRVARRICVEEDAICGNALDELMIAGEVMRLLSRGGK